MKKHLYILLIFIVLPGFILAQKPDSIPATQLDEQLERLQEQSDQELDFSSIVDELEYYKEHPLNINSATYEDLQKLVFLNDIQITNILAYVENHGGFVNVYELQLVEGLYPVDIHKILPYIRVEKIAEKFKLNLSDVFNYGRNDVFLRYQRILEQQQGFSPISDSMLAESPNSRYAGSPDKLYLKYQFRYYDKIRWGITAEKDPGEEFFKGSNKKGFDFYTAHFAVADIGHIKDLVLGDYHVQFGQGLVAMSGVSFGKSSNVLNIKKGQSGIRPYTSTDENRFFRGIASTVKVSGFEITGFYSHKKIDANITTPDSLTDEEAIASSFLETGYHSTPSEIEDENAVEETMFGGHVSYIKKGLNLGVSALDSRYGAALQSNSQLYTKYRFSGDHNLVFGADYKYSWRKLGVFGEVAQSENGGKATVNGFMYSLHPQLSTSLLYRNYSVDFQSVYANAFAESSSASNEKGLFFGFTGYFNSKISFSAYADHFRFPWLSYRVDAPMNGNEYLAQLNFIQSRYVEMGFQYREENKKINQSSAYEYHNSLVDKQRRNFRYSISYSVSRKLMLKNRVEYNFVTIDKTQSQGYLLYQDVIYNSTRVPLDIAFRYAVFDTDDYSSAIYAYENDVLYAFSVPSYFYKGYRSYLMVHYVISKRFEFWLKGSLTNYSNKNQVGSDLTQIDAPHKTEVRAQVRMKF